MVTGELASSVADTPPLTIPSALARSALTCPLSPALTDGRTRLTYRQLQEEVLGIGRVLAQRVKTGDRVALQLPRSAEYVVLYLAVLSIGAAVLPLSHELSEAETVTELATCAPVLLLRDPDVRAARRPFPAAGDDGTAPAPAVMDIAVCAHTDGDLTRLRSAVGRAPRAGVTGTHAAPGGGADPESPAVLLATSGSFGLPKRVVLTHRALLANARAHRASLDATAHRETALAAVPLNFGYCNTVQLVGQFDSAGHVVLLGGDFLPSRFGRLVEEHRVTSTLLVPSMLRLLTLGDWHRTYDLSSLRHIVYGGAPTPPEILRDLERRLPGVELVETYGQTEAGPRITTMRPRDRAAHPGSVGRPLPGVEVTIRDRDFRPLPPGATGEIVVRGPGTMTGYHARPEETARVLRGGRLLTGDLGRLDKDGFLYLSGRLRNIAIVSGMNVSLEEVEACLTAHPAVTEAVCGVRADARAGETLVAWVRLTVAEQATVLDELTGFCRARLSAHKLPRRIVAVADFPRTRTGKIDRSAVLARSRAAPPRTDGPGPDMPEAEEVGG
ncbi:class I adenylate-forming enzyme family protein [Streptomyces sp. NPDC004629]|uniref:class I adenylate-forming enzyme family protein n=1 Tax=Streptomyces sp. NPDC004629 TaxID=3364705 RepID=UPI0036863125